MSRKATSWSYGPEVLGLKLTARDLAFLRAVCWSIHPKLGRTRPLTEKTLARLTGIGSPTTPSLKPGLLYVRPRPESLADAFSEPLSADETVWMADALEFIRDTPANRTSLFAALRKSGSFAVCRAALDCVRQTSRNGRKIGNRVGYLLTALHTGETPHGKTDSA